MLIHAVYLINCASEDPELREKSLTVADALAARRRRDRRRRRRAARRLGAEGRRRRGDRARRQGDRRPRWPRPRLPAAPGEHRRAPAARWGARSPSWPACSTPPAPTSGSGSASTPATCWPPATTSATPRRWRTLSEFDAEVGLERLRSLHVNDSQTPLGSNRDRHAPLGEGEIGEDGCAAFLSEPAFDGLPRVFEGPGIAGKGVELEDIRVMRELREQGARQRNR